MYKAVAHKIILLDVPSVIGASTTYVYTSQWIPNGKTPINPIKPTSVAFFIKYSDKGDASKNNAPADTSAIDEIVVVPPFESEKMAIPVLISL